MLRVYVNRNNGTLISSVTYNDVADIGKVSSIIQSRGWKYDIVKNRFQKNGNYLYLDSRNCTQDIWITDYDKYPIQEFLKDVRRKEAAI